MRRTPVFDVTRATTRNESNFVGVMRRRVVAFRTRVVANLRAEQTQPGYMANITLPS